MLSETSGAHKTNQCSLFSQIKERICLDDKSKYCLEKHNYAVNGQNYRVSKCSVCVLHTNRSQGVLKSKKRKEKIKKH